MIDDAPDDPRPIAERMFDALEGVAAVEGVDLEVQGGGKGRPRAVTINVVKPILEVQREAAQLLRGEGLYLRNGRVVTISEAGEEEEMEAVRFLSYLPRFAVVCRGVDEETGRPRRIDLSAKRAGEILAGDLFKQMLPEVTRILPARLPVFDKDGKPRLLGTGYDAEHRVFVMRDAPAIVRMDIDDATGYLRELYQHFSWGDSGRSLAAQVSAQVGLFCQLLFPDAAAVPMYYYNANMEGSGKSILAEIPITPIYGHCVTDDFGQGEEFLKMLAGRAFGYASYIFMDDVEGLIKSQTLNRWVVQSYWSNRVMHSHRMMTVPKKCMTLMTANRATLSDDLVRRSVIVDLFSEKTAAERLREREAGQVREVTSAWLSRPEVREEILSALWAMVEFWADQGMPGSPRTMASFVEWSSVVGGIVSAAGFGDPFEPAKLADAGDKWQVEWEKLFAGVVRRFRPTKEGLSIALPEWCAVAREEGLYIEKLGELEMTLALLEESPKLWDVIAKRTEFVLDDREKRVQAARYMHPQKQASPFAKILKKRGGQVFEVDGKRYRFSERNSNTSTFVVVCLD